MRKKKDDYGAHLRNKSIQWIFDNEKKKLSQIWELAISRKPLRQHKYTFFKSTKHRGLCGIGYAHIEITDGWKTVYISTHELCGLDVQVGGFKMQPPTHPEKIGKLIRESGWIHNAIIESRLLLLDEMESEMNYNFKNGIQSVLPYIESIKRFKLKGLVVGNIQSAMRKSLSRVENSKKILNTFCLPK